MSVRIHAITAPGMFQRTAIVLLAAGCLCCGCKESAPEETGRVTLRLWHIYGGGEGAQNARERKVLDNAIRRFETLHPNVSVKTETFPNDAYKSKLNIEIVSGTPPDVFFTWGGGPLAELARARRVVDLTDALKQHRWRERILPAPLGFCTVNEKTYAVPLDLSCVPLWYNADLFQRHNLTPPRTFDQLLSVCAALRKKNITPLALGNMKQWPGAFYFIYLASRTGGSQLFFDAAARLPGKKFDDPAFVKAGALLQQLVQADAFSPGFNGIMHDQARAQFFGAKAAMYLMGTWLVAKTEQVPDFLPKMKCIPFPTTPNGKGDPTTIVGGVNCAFAAATTGKHPQLAIALLRSLTSEQTAAEWCAIGRIPALTVPPDTLKKLPQPTQAALNLLHRAKFLQPYYDQYLPPHLAKAHKDTTQELFAGTLTPQDAASRMEQHAQEKR